MAEPVQTQSSIDSLTRSQSTTSLKSNSTIESRRSSMNTLFDSEGNRRGHGIFSKIGNGFHTMFRRFSQKYKTLSQLEIQILSTITHFNREEILEW
jgi:hypothetical protein